HLLLGLVEDLRADRNLERDGRAGRTGAVGARAVIAAARLEVLGVAVVDQRVEVGHRLDDDVAAAPAVAAVGAAELDALLAPKADGAGTAVTALHEDLGLVQELHARTLWPRSWQKRSR